MDQEETSNYINSLPVEVLTVILQYVEVPDIVSFGTTCKQFWEVVQNNEILWKLKFKSLVPPIMFDSVNKHCDDGWLNAYKNFCNLRKQIYTEIIAMSPKFYWQYDEVSLEDVRHFFNIALSNNLNYFYVIFILQDMIKKGNACVESKHVKKPYTLTEMYYAKFVLRYLIQTYLGVKWVKSNHKNELDPEIVVTLFVQWTDNINLHLDHEVKKRIDELVERVETILNAQNPKLKGIPVHERCAKQLVDEKQILKAVSESIYHQRHMAVTSAVSLDTLNINKVLTLRCGNVCAVGAVYQAVARRCGVRLRLVAFPSHLFLQGRDGARAFTVDLATGDLKPIRRCPFSQANRDAEFEYCPDSFLQYIYTSYHRSMGVIKDWNMQNTVHLLDFLVTTYNPSNPYRNFLSYLINSNYIHAMSTPLDLTYLYDEHIEIIRSLANLNERINPVTKQVVVKRRTGDVKYAVGMICYHKQFDYVGIIRGWDVGFEARRSDRFETDLKLQFGLNQPFYYVIAADQSDRYVAQENLTEIKQSTRLYHLEDDVAMDFTHFDGFSYVLNEEKKSEYPDEGPVVAQYRNRSHYKL